MPDIAKRIMDFSCWTVFTTLAISVVTGICLVYKGATLQNKEAYFRHSHMIMQLNSSDSLKNRGELIKERGSLAEPAAQYSSEMNVFTNQLADYMIPVGTTFGASGLTLILSMGYVATREIRKRKHQSSP